VYLRGLNELVAHVGAPRPIDVLWLGKMSLASSPLVEDLWHRGALADPVVLPRYWEDPAVQRRLTGLERATSVMDLVRTR
jgi:hypothetical protein